MSGSSYCSKCRQVTTTEIRITKNPNAQNYGKSYEACLACNQFKKLCPNQQQQQAPPPQHQPQQLPQQYINNPPPTVIRQPEISDNSICILKGYIDNLHSSMNSQFQVVLNDHRYILEELKKLDKKDTFIYSENDNNV